MTTALRVLIKGGGVAGLTAARSVLHYVPNAKVTLFEARPSCQWQADRGVGLWNMAVRRLFELGLPLSTGRQHAHATPPASYRSIDGVWLSKCSSHLASKVRVLTLRENSLLQLLKHPNVHYRYQTAVQNVMASRKDDDNDCGDGITVKLETGEVLDGDICIVASGGGTSAETKTSCCWNDSISGIVPSTTNNEPLAMCGREGPFETLVSAGLRFAVVPLDAESFFWFATFPENENTELLSVEQAMEKVKQFNCHVPISALLEATDPESLVVRRTYSAATAAAPATTKLIPSDYAGPRIITIGDAENLLSNNLAQGASVAVEDGYMVGRLVGSLNNPKDLDNVKKIFRRKRKARIAACRTMNQFTQLISEYPQISKLMHYVPAALNANIFDASLVYSLGGKEAISEI